MEWRAFAEFEESRVVAEMADVRQDTEVARELVSRYLQTLKTVVGGFAYAIEIGEKSTWRLRSCIDQLDEAYQAAETLRRVVGGTWHHIPDTAYWVGSIQKRVRIVVRSTRKEKTHFNLDDIKFLRTLLKQLWMATREAEQRVSPIEHDNLC